MNTISAIDHQRKVAERELLKNQLFGKMENREILEMWLQARIYHFLKRIKQLEKNREGMDHLIEIKFVFVDYFKKISLLLENITESFDESIQSLTT